jgi:rare lipoprotein A
VEPQEPVLPAELAPVQAPAPPPVQAFDHVFPAAAGAFIVQAASFSTAERAERAAEALKGSVIPSGRYFRVHTGPFATRGEAEASLAKVRAAGYTDARISKTG